MCVRLPGFPIHERENLLSELFQGLLVLLDAQAQIEHQVVDSAVDELLHLGGTVLGAGPEARGSQMAPCVAQ